MNDALQVICPTCAADPGEPCTGSDGQPMRRPHLPRTAEALS